ncbi:MAG: UDP-N-acetylmuramoyl-L-alanyl-D-glutamate--2,6-diaminopimelate ligase [Bacteroidia bacterium]
MFLSALIHKLNVRSQHGPREVEVNDFHFDSRLVGEGDAFVALSGTQVDGHDYIAQAIAKGAKVIVTERMPAEIDPAVTWIQVADTAEALGYMASNFYGNPAAQLQIIGITGTNGKTSVATLLHTMFNQMGLHAGLISTVQNMVGKYASPATHTTPDPKQLHKLFAEMVEQGCNHCFMEVSSHALTQKRTAGIPFAGAIFTNITHDHLDYHGTFAEYIKAKKMLFDQLLPSAFALINIDDKNGRVMVQNTAAKVKTFALRRLADYHARLLENTFEGLLLDINGSEVWCRLLGAFNAYNLLTAYGVAQELGITDEEALLSLSRLGGVEGRFEPVRSPSGLVAIVDYAHTPDALKNVLSTIKDVLQGAGNILVVVGCGGDRDAAKRPVMGAIASEMADQAIFTSDNPRSEKPEAIITAMWEGVPVEQRRKVLRVNDRREAIRLALSLANPADVVLVAGKGHERYQEIEGVRHAFDDREVLQQLFAETTI